MRRFVVAVLAFAVLAGCGPTEPKTAGGPPAMRRLTEEQYRRIIADVFGEDIVIGGRFDPVNRSGGLLAIGASATAINGSAFERYDALARAIAAQVVAPDNRDVLIPCKPADPGAADDACAGTFFKETGRLLFRRPLTDAELALQVSIARDAAAKLNSFYAGMGAALAAMLVRPEFLFITDTREPDPTRPGQERLTATAKAARLSFLLWNTTPDDALLTAAEKGELHDRSGLARQVDRMIASPRFAGGVRAFFVDMLGFDAFENLQKDPVIYPAFGLAAANQAREQILRTIVDQTVIHPDDYRALFTTRKTVMSGPLGLVYRVPVSQPDGWVPYEFPAGDAHVGIQSLAGFVALFSHPGRSSATLRGKAIREILMCQKVPDPPANVDFTLVSDNHNPIYKTARQRLAAHSTDPTCAGCHRIMDPVGLSLENFDGAGQWRPDENGAAIDASGELDGVAYADAAGLGKALAASPAVSSCVVGRAYGYGTGRPLAPAEKPVLAYLEQRFAKSGYRIPALFREIALSEAFYAVTPPDGAKTAADAVKDGRS
jgi:hypothetical protein